VIQPFDLRLQASLLLTFLLFTALPLHGQSGAVYYVNASTGNNANPGSLTAPWKTIQKAANTVVAGATVNVAAGTYDERVQVSRSGSAGNLLTFQAQGMVVMQGSIFRAIT